MGKWPPTLRGTMENLANKGLPYVDEKPEAEPKVFIISGKGYHLRMLPLHLVSISLLWVLLRLTIFTMPLSVVQQHPYTFWGTSIIVAICLHMAAFGRVFQSFAELRQVMQILKEHCEGTKNDIWEKVSVLQQKGSVDGSVSGRSSKITLDIDEETSNTLLTIR